MDLKFVAPLKNASKKKYYEFTAIDVRTRLRVLRIFPRLNQKTAILFVDYVLKRVELPDLSSIAPRSTVSLGHSPVCAPGSETSH
jgi:hypothetical protein